MSRHNKPKPIAKGKRSPLNDNGIILAAARHYYQDRYTQEQIAEVLSKSEPFKQRYPHWQLSQENVSDLIGKALEKGFVTFSITPPSELVQQDKLAKRLRPSGVREVAVVQEDFSHPKNLENISDAGVLQLIQAIHSIDKPQIRLTLSCGETTRRISEKLVALAENDSGLRRKLNGKRLEIYPTTVHSSYEVITAYPHTLVIQLTLGLRRALPDSIVIGYAPTLPPDFYTMDENNRSRYSKDYGIDRIMQDARDADIILIGLGIADDPAYKSILGHLSIDHSELPGFAHPLHPEVCYIPVDQNGEEFPGVSNKIVGLKIKELREISRRTDRFVIAHGGGQAKKGRLNQLFEHPCYNILITDKLVAETWLAC